MGCESSATLTWALLAAAAAARQRLLALGARERRRGARVRAQAVARAVGGGQQRRGAAGRAAALARVRVDNERRFALVAALALARDVVAHLVRGARLRRRRARALVGAGNNELLGRTRDTLGGAGGRDGVARARVARAGAAGDRGVRARRALDADAVPARVDAAPVRPDCTTKEAGGALRWARRDLGDDGRQGEVGTYQGTPRSRTRRRRGHDASPAGT